MKTLGCVAVLCGGSSSEREVSLVSGQAVFETLCSLGVTARLIDTQKTPLLTALHEVDRAFIALHGKGGEDGEVQAILRALGIPFTGSGRTACAVTMDKMLTKALWRDAGLPASRDMRLLPTTRYEELVAHLQCTSFVVKPALEGSSVGVSRVCSAEALPAAYQKAGGAGAKIMAEPWVVGRELTYAILGDEVLPGVEIIASQSHPFYDYAAKYEAQDTRYLCPPPLDPAVDAQLRALAWQAFRVVGCKTWGRVDFLLDEGGQAHLLEINTVPGMTPHSLVPMAAKAAGLDFPTLVRKILEDASTE